MHARSCHVIENIQEIGYSYHHSLHSPQDNNGGADEVKLANGFFGLLEHLAMVMEADREFILEAVSEALRLPSNVLCAPRSFRVDLVTSPNAIEGLARLLIVHSDNPKNDAKLKSQASRTNLSAENSTIKLKLNTNCSPERRHHDHTLQEGLRL